MNVYWLEQSTADVPKDNDWLSENETASLRRMSFSKRSDEWRLGRWTAKRALSAFLNMSADPLTFCKMDIRPAPSGAPEIFFDTQPVAATVSLSHRGGLAACALTISGAEMGCDVEVAEPRSEAFVADYFTAEEQALIARVSATDRDRLLALIWSAKESALKALREGLRLDTRRVVVSLFEASCDAKIWSRMLVRYTGEHRSDARVFHGWWRLAGNVLRTMVAAPPPDSPGRLAVPEYCLEGISSVCAQ